MSVRHTELTGRSWVLAREPVTKQARPPSALIALQPHLPPGAQLGLPGCFVLSSLSHVSAPRHGRGGVGLNSGDPARSVCLGLGAVCPHAVRRGHHSRRGPRLPPEC